MKKKSVSELEAQLEAASAEPVDPIKRIDALCALAWAIRGDQPRAHAMAEEARALAIEHGYTLGQARATRTLALTIVDLQGLSETFELGEEAKRLFDEAGDAVGRAASRDFLAGVYEYIGDLASGMEYALDALSIAREVGDPVRQGYALCNVGGILAASGEVDDGVARLQEALRLFESVDDADGVGTICSKLSKINRSIGELDEALVYAERCYDAANKGSDAMFSRAIALITLAELQDQRGNVAQAERLYREAVDNLPEAVGKAIGPSARIPLGRLLIKRDAIDEAEQVLGEALDNARDVGISLNDEAAAHAALAELRQRQGRLSEAIAHLRDAQLLRERVEKQNVRNKIAQVELRAEMKAAKKDAEIHKLRFVELHGIQSKLVEAEKMALLGKLAAGTAHELNTPLGVLRSNAQLVSTAAQQLAKLDAPAQQGSKASRLVDVIASCRRTNDEAIERIAAIALSLGRFTQLDEAERRTFDVIEGLNSALTLLTPTLPDTIQIERRFGKVPKIVGWPRELNLAFLTVLQNAAQAITGAGSIAVETSLDDEKILVQVRDSGRGMSEDQAANLFDVAWSKDGKRTSMRLGLSAAYSTMQKHGGTLEVDSTLGQGTTITFCFPIHHGVK